MTEKITSEEAYENLRSVDAGILSIEQFGRQTLQTALDIRANLSDQEFPSAKSFLDWARREELVEAVSRGVYRWTTVTEAEAADVGRKLTEDTKVITDDYPGVPMVLSQSHQTSIDVDLYTSDERVSRKVKKRLKAPFLSNPATVRVTLHCDSPAQAFEDAR